MQVYVNTLVDAMSTTTFADWFRTQLKYKRWGVSDFHRESGVPRATVYTWYAGTRVPDPASCDVISDILMVPLDEVLAVAGHRPDIDELLSDPDRAKLMEKLSRLRLTGERVYALERSIDGYFEYDRATGQSVDEGVGSHDSPVEDTEDHRSP